MSGTASRAPQTLVDERNALQVYFDALLRGIPDQTQPETVVDTAEPEIKAATVQAPESPLHPEEGTPAPAWGQQRFQAMLFKVSGLVLAVPLIELSGVQEWGAQKVTPLPSRAPWFLGLTCYRNHNVPVVDTALLVLPEDRRHLVNGSPQERLTRIVFIGDGRWGLACDQVAEVVTLEPKQVRWRALRATRPWLAGTVIEHMCALVDPTPLAAVLASGAGEAGVELPWNETQE